MWKRADLNSSSHKNAGPLIFLLLLQKRGLCMEGKAETPSARTDGVLRRPEQDPIQQRAPFCLLLLPIVLCCQAYKKFYKR